MKLSLHTVSYISSLSVFGEYLMYNIAVFFSNALDTVVGKSNWSHRYVSSSLLMRPVNISVYMTMK